MYSEKVDILLATYNGCRFLESQIVSILNQTYPHINIIIRDDCSTDNTSEILKEFKKKNPDKITLIPSSKHLGVNGNFSELLNHAKAPYIMFSDQDDVWLPNKVEISLEKMKSLEKQNNSNLPLLVFTDLKVVDEELRTIAPSFWKYTKRRPEFSNLNYLLVMNVVTGCTSMFNQSLLKAALPIPPEIHIYDWWLALVCAATGKLDYISTTTVLYRQHPSNLFGAQKTTIPSQIFWILGGRIYKKFYKEYQFVQAKHLVNRFHSQIPQDNIILLNNFVDLPSLPQWKRSISIVKNGFYTNLKLLNPFLILNPFDLLWKLISSFKGQQNIKINK